MKQLEDPHDVILAYPEGHADVFGEGIADEVPNQLASFGESIDVPKQPSSLKCDWRSKVSPNGTIYRMNMTEKPVIISG